MKKTHKTVIVTIILMLILGGLVLWGFFMITSQKQDPKVKAKKTEVEKLLDKDIEENYPGTPREVLKLYCRITQCLYNDEMTEEEQKQLLSQLRRLFDDELLQNNPEQEHIIRLKEDIDGYHENDQKISGYDVQLGSETEYATIKSKKYATLKLYLITQQTGKQKRFTKSNEEFLLRKDEKENWKIVHWKLITEEDMNE